MNNKYNLIFSKPENAATNMAIDESLAKQKENLPTLRLYSWVTPAFSIGRFQKPEEVLNLAVCQESGVQVVRRITGGGAIFHDQELTYSLVWPRSLLDKNLSVKDSYRKLMGFLLAFYQELGLRNIVFGHNENLSKHEFCFLGLEKYDFLIDGKKLGGNAQKRTRDMVFIHGSIPINFDLAKCNEFLINKIPVNNPPFISLVDLGLTISFGDLQKLLIASFEHEIKLYEY
ncbi:MAG: lipoate--protein ligase family protein [Candidatus Margulisiibacteriota bacterium]|jgi:lipoate-protein ligase A